MTRRRRPEQIEPEWAGFPRRLKFAIETRLDEDPALTQNDIAEAANYDSGNLSRLLGEKSTKWRGVTANTVLSFARALKVRPLWLLMGIEPSGLGAAMPSSPAPAPQPFQSERPTG